MAIMSEKCEIHFMCGEDNHLNLIGFLMARLRHGSMPADAEVHSLWYRWKDNILQICGADSETRDDYDRLRAFVDDNKSLVLARLKKLP